MARGKENYGAKKGRSHHKVKPFRIVKIDLKAPEVSQATKDAARKKMKKYELLGKIKAEQNAAKWLDEKSGSSTKKAKTLPFAGEVREIEVEVEK